MRRSHHNTTQPKTCATNHDSIDDLFGSDESDSEAERDAERGTIPSAAAGGDARTPEDDEEKDEDDGGGGAAAVDGHVPPTGTRLKEPHGRKAPVRTAWGELANGYIRTDPNETGRPRKIGINYFSGQTWENMLGYV